MWEYTTRRQESSIPWVVRYKTVQDTAVHHREQRCFCNKGLDRGKLLAPKTQTLQLDHPIKYTNNISTSISSQIGVQVI